MARESDASSQEGNIKSSDFKRNKLIGLRLNARNSNWIKVIQKIGKWV